MRRSLLLTLLVLTPLGVAACAKPPAPGAATATTAPAESPAATPAEAGLQMIDAMADGDEAAFRRVVRFRPPGGYPEARMRAVFAAARLHRAVAAHGVTGRRVRSAGFDPNETLLVRPPPTTDGLASTRQRMRDAKWKVDGDVATAVGDPPPGWFESSARAERVPGGGWVMLFSDKGMDGAPEHLRMAAASQYVTADATDAATAAIEAGKVRTIREVNDIITSHRNAVAARELAKVKASPPSGPVVVVTDVETGKPVAGATVTARSIISPGRIRHLTTTTDENGRTRLQIEPESVHDVHVRAEGYARRNADLDLVEAAGERPREIHLKIGKPIVIEVMLVLPDERRAAISVYEGEASEPAKPGVRHTIEPKRLKLPVAWDDEPPKLPGHNPMLRLNLFAHSPHKKLQSVVHRVTHAQLKDGRKVPVFRDAPPVDPKTFGMYLIGTNGFGDSVFVIGTLADARTVEGTGQKFQWTRNDRVLGPAPATRATTSHR